MSEPLCVEAIEVRLLVPLQLDASQLASGRALPRGELIGASGLRYEPVRGPDELYRGDVFPSVQHFLFHGFGSGGFSCWKIDSHTAARWFDKARVALDRDDPGPAA